MKKVLIILFCVLSYSSFGQDFGRGTDPGEFPDAIPLPGIVYFLIAALAVGAKKLYNARNKF